MDLMGISRTIDHAVYTLLNTLAMILWRLDAALLGVSMLGYRTQDWLTGPEGGVWFLLAKLAGPEGLINLAVWQAFLLLAVTLYGFSLLLRIFGVQAVNLPRLFFFAVMAYTFISQGSELLRAAEAWRSEAGSYAYTLLAGESGLNIDLPGVTPSSDEPLLPPQDLDGQPPLRGWEAVATSYFLADSAEELHSATPPAAFLTAYCLYDPGQPLNEQSEENSAGCSPRKAWDEWQEIQISAPITQVWGIPLPVDVAIDLPVFQEHPENRQLGLRQAQAGLARLALGPVVALYPLVESSVSLMLALSASFIYLSLPITLLFGFFLYTESMATRLLLQLISVFIRTLILQGLAALFLLLLVGVSAAQAGLTVYLGLVGVGLLGGFFLIRLANETMRDTLTQSLGAVGSVWMGATTGVLGQGARQPAQAALGAAKLAAAGVAMAVTARSVGAWQSLDVVAPAGEAARSGLADLRQGAPQPMEQFDQKLQGTIPAPLARLAANSTASQDNSTATPAAQPPVPLPGTLWPASGGRMATVSAAPSPFMASPATPPPTNTLESSPPLVNNIGAAVYGTVEQPDRTVERWAEQVYQARARRGQGRQQAAETGKLLLGEELAGEASGAMARHSLAETRAVLQATRQSAVNLPPEQFIRADGTITQAGLQAVQAQLDPASAAAFQGKRGQRDLAALMAAELRPRKEVEPEAFRQAAARAADGRGEQSPGRTVPRALGLDPAAAGAHFAGLNRFTRLSEQAGLTPEQRQQLLQEVARTGQVSTGLRQELEALVQRQGRVGPKLDDVISSARALPETLNGPQRVHLPEAAAPASPATVPPKKSDQKKAVRPLRRPAALKEEIELWQPTK